jgi:NADP-dependent 3-hydroxy acid dehydrogenase YdfG
VADGASLALLDFDAASVAEILTAIAGAPPVREWEIDVTPEDQLRALITGIDAETPLDGLVNVTVVGLLDAVLDLPSAQWRRTFHVNAALLRFQEAGHCLTASLPHCTRH